MQTTEAVVPFRWDMAKVAELGGLLNADAPSKHATRRQCLPRIDGNLRGVELWDNGEAEVLDCTARIVAYAGDADIVFVGRSLESVYELLRGAAWGTALAPRFSQLLISLRGDDGLALGPWSRIAPLVPYLRVLGLDPRQLTRRRHPLVFADLVSTGGTFEMLIALLARIAAEQRADWNVIRRVLNIVAVIEHSDGRYWHDVAHRLCRAGVQRVRNVRVSGTLWGYFASNTVALAASHHEGRWSDPRAASPVHTEETASHIRRGYVLHWTARTRAYRERLVRAIARHAPHHSPYLSSLMHTLRCAPRLP